MYLKYLLLYCALVIVGNTAYSQTVTFEPSKVQVLIDGKDAGRIELTFNPIVEGPPRPEVIPKPISPPVAEVPKPQEPEAIKLKLAILEETATDTSIKLSWIVVDAITGEPVTVDGQIEYGTTKDLGTKNPPEISRDKYSTHIQTIKGLTPAKHYYYRITSVDQNNNIVRSGTEAISTRIRSAPAPPKTIDTPRNTAPVAPGWPANADDRLPMSGIFYGMTHGGLQTGNTTLAIEHSFRFRAEASTPITAFTWENRVLTDSNIKTRTSPDFLNCKNNRLTPAQCGYTLGNSYHVGNGGQILITIHPDNGRGWPNERVVLGEASKSYIPAEHGEGKWLTHTMKKPVNVVAGALYHIKLRNLKPARLPLYRNSNAAAKAKPAGTGAISLNGVWHGDPIRGSVGKWGPYYGDKGQGALYRQSTSGKWTENHQTMPLIGIRYGTVWGGNVVTGYDNIKHVSEGKLWYAKQTGYKRVQGGNKARQTFKVLDADRTINGVHISFSHTRRASGAPLTVQLKNSSGNVLASGRIQASRAVMDRVKKGVASKNINSVNANTWGYTDLKQTVLKKNSTYHLELSAPSNAGFHIMSFFPMTLAGQTRNEWHGAKAEFNSGKGWTVFDEGNGRPNRDLPVVFTLVGMPKKLP